MSENSEKMCKLLKEGELFSRSGSWDWNPVTNELFWSDGVYNILDIPLTTPPSVENFLNSLVPEDRDFAMRSIQASLKGHPYEIEVRVMGKGGPIKTIFARGSVDFDSNGQPVRMFGIIQDVSDKKIIEEKFKILYEHSSDAIMTLEPPTWKFTAGNLATLKMFNCKDEQEFNSFGPWEFSPEFQVDGSRSDEKAKEMIDLAMKTGSNFFKWTHKRHNGSDFPATVLLTRVKVGNKEFLQATVRDITDQILSQKRLEDSESKYKLLTETSPDCIKIFDLSGNLTFINSGGKMEHRLKNGDDIYKFKPVDAVVEEDKPKLINAFNNAKQGIGSVIELRHTKDGSTRETCSEMIHPIVDNGGKIIGILAVSRDISDIKRSERELMNKMDEFKKLNELMVGRELKMIELKKKVEDLKALLPKKDME